MATKKKMLQAAAGNAGGAGAGLDVEDVFSTYLYKGAGAAGQTITNGIDLATEGGLIWIKRRDGARDHYLHDTDMASANSYLSSNLTSALASTTAVTPNVDGFSIGAVYSDFINATNDPFFSWTFRKAPKFFDVVTYTGNGVAGRQISHNLGSKPGFIIVKRTDTGNDPYNNWRTAHIEGSTLTSIVLNLTSDASTTPWNLWSDASTATSAYAAAQQTNAHFTVGSNASINGSGGSFVAYLFAHNDGDGDFGPDGDADIIKCGSWAGTGSEQTIDLGFEPQWVLMKDTAAASGWFVVDNMRGMSASGNWVYLLPNSSSAEAALSTGYGPELVSNGIKLLSTDTNFNSTSRNIIYIAIRRGTKVPESATEVFDVTEVAGAGAGTSVTTGFPVDFTIVKAIGSSTSWEVWDRLRGARKYLSTNSTAADGTAFTSADQWLHDNMTGFSWNAGDSWSNSGGDFINYSWKRAPGYFDVVAYTGNGTAGRTVSHNLGVAPEMMWVKSRDGSYDWAVYHKGLNGGTDPEDYYLRLNRTFAETDFIGIWDDTAPTDSNFTVRTDSRVNNNSNTYIAYLFASLDGISKVGSYTGDGNASQNIECGFSAGARFVLIKAASKTSDWLVVDTERGFDERIWLNQTSAEETHDYVDPYAGGFAVKSTYGLYNESGASYIFYAIA